MRKPKTKNVDAAVAAPATTTTTTTAATTARMTEEQFVLKAIVGLRKDGYKGIHSRNSGFNAAFRKYFGEGADPVATTSRLRDEGKIHSHFCVGGVMLYLPGDMPAPRDFTAEKALGKILAIA